MTSFTGYITDHSANNKKTPSEVKLLKGTGKNVPAVVVDLDNTPHVTRSRGEAAADTEQASFSFPATSFQVFLLLLFVLQHCYTVCTRPAQMIVCCLVDMHSLLSFIPV